MPNSAYSKCVCKSGFYDPDGDGPRQECVMCEAGNYCAGGFKLPCPAHTYQDAGEATACKSCASTRDENGIYSNCGQRKQLQYCAAGQSALVCVPCAMCRKAYLTSSVVETQVDCYKSH